jgi:hypothetical protein
MEEEICLQLQVCTIKEKDLLGESYYRFVMADICTFKRLLLTHVSKPIFDRLRR